MSCTTIIAVLDRFMYTHHMYDITGILLRSKEEKAKEMRQMTFLIKMIATLIVLPWREKLPALLFYVITFHVVYI